MAYWLDESNALREHVEGGWLTGPAATHTVNFMRPFTFAAVLCGTVVSWSRAQAVPGRDLLDFPIGTVAEAPAIAVQSADGLRNPAAAALRPGVRIRLSAGALITPQDQGVAAQLVSGAAALPGELTAALSVVRATVSDIVRTGSDPRSIGADVSYGTTVYSAVATRRTKEFLSTGVAVRYRVGQLDQDRRAALGVDGGVLAEGLFGRDVRLGVSTFLWRPGAPTTSDRPTFSAAGDFRAAGRDERRELRAGYGVAYTPSATSEQYLFGSGRAGPLEARAGLARAVRFGDASWRLRLGVGLHHARYALGIAREEAGAGLDPTYQFTLSSAYK